jgi:hypothetical protein
MIKKIINKIRRFLTKIELYFTGHWTLCGECKRFSPPGYCCPYCKDK